MNTHFSHGLPWGQAQAEPSWMVHQQWENHQHIKAPEKGFAGGHGVWKENNWLRRNQGTEEKLMLGGERKSCHILGVRVSALSNPDMGKLWQHPEVLMLLRGLHGTCSAVVRKTAQRSHAIAENKIILLTFSLPHCCFLLGVHLRFWYFS